MSHSRRILPPLAALLAVLICEMPASADTLTQTRLVPLQTTGFTDSSSLTFNRFNVADSVLDSIQFQFSGHIEGRVRLENQSGAPRTIATFIGATLTLRRPDNVVLLNISPRAEKSYSLASFDGSVNFADSSGVTDNSLVDDESGSMTFVPPSAELAQFVGPGTFSLTLSTESDSGDSGGGALTTIFNAMASAQVNVIYNYTPVLEPPDPFVIPEPSSFALLGIGGGLTLLCGHWRGRRRRDVS